MLAASFDLSTRVVGTPVLLFCKLSAVGMPRQ